MGHLILTPELIARKCPAGRSHQKNVNIDDKLINHLVFGILINLASNSANMD